MIECRDVFLTLGAFQLENVSLSLRKGEYYFLMGPSGAGKTILLEVIAGLYHPDRGTVLIRERDMENVLPEHRNIGLVYQDYSLFPHLTVERNIAFGMRMKGHSSNRIENRVNALLRDLNIYHLKERRPLTLSGGEQQRVALARALATEPEILLLDEPLAALDPLTKKSLITELGRIHREADLTIIQVTHDPNEVHMLGTRVGLLMDGRLLQEGPIESVFSHPKTSEIARFLGFENIMPALVTESDFDRSILRVADIPLQVNQHLIQGSEVTLCIRSEEIILLPFFGEKKDTANQFIGRIIEITQTNSVARVTVDLGNEWTILAPRTHIRSMHLSPGSEISVSIPPEAIHIIPQSQ